jgi:hypothetical protein
VTRLGRHSLCWPLLTTSIVNPPFRPRKITPKSLLSKILTVSLTHSRLCADSFGIHQWFQDFRVIEGEGGTPWLRQELSPAHDTQMLSVSKHRRPGDNRAHGGRCPGTTFHLDRSSSKRKRLCAVPTLASTETRLSTTRDAIRQTGICANAYWVHPGLLSRDRIGNNPTPDGVYTHEPSPTVLETADSKEDCRQPSVRTELLRIRELIMMRLTP